MSETAAVFTTLVVYNALLIGVGVWASRRNTDVEDFYLAGRGLGAWVAAISASASSSSAWTLLGVSGAAYAWGWPALWLFPATVGGFLVNWFWVAPRLKSLADRENAVTLASVLAPQALGESRERILRTAGVIIVFSFVFYVASQFEAAGKAFESVFGLEKEPSILIGAGIVLAYTLLGGFWAVSVTDTIQGLLMSLAAIVLPLIALAGGPRRRARAACGPRLARRRRVARRGRRVRARHSRHRHRLPGPAARREPLHGAPGRE